MAAATALKEKIKEATETGRAKILHLEEEAEKLVKKVLEKGRDAQAEGKKRLEDLVNRAPLLEKVREADVVRRVQALRAEVEERFEGGMDRLLQIFGIASRENVEKLSKRLDNLASRVAELTKRLKTGTRKKGGSK